MKVGKIRIYIEGQERPLEHHSAGHCLLSEEEVAEGIFMCIGIDGWPKDETVIRTERRRFTASRGPSQLRLQRIAKREKYRTKYVWWI